MGLNAQNDKFCHVNKDGMLKNLKALIKKIVVMEQLHASGRNQEIASGSRMGRVQMFTPSGGED